MIVKCMQCRRIRVDGMFRLPWPEELDGRVAEIFCPRCAKERLARVQAGEFAYDGEAAWARGAVNS